jgi:hypothetical protein
VVDEHEVAHAEAPRSGWVAGKRFPLAVVLAAYVLTLVAIAKPGYELNGWTGFLGVMFMPGRPCLGDLGMLLAVVGLVHRGCLMVIVGWMGIVWWGLSIWFLY